MQDPRLKVVVENLLKETKFDENRWIRQLSILKNDFNSLYNDLSVPRKIYELTPSLSSSSSSSTSGADLSTLLKSDSDKNINKVYSKVIDFYNDNRGNIDEKIYKALDNDMKLLLQYYYISDLHALRSNFMDVLNNASTNYQKITKDTSVENIMSELYTYSY